MSALAIAFISPDDGLPGWGCWWKEAFDFDCPGCGLTRSFIAMAHGRFGDAMELNAVGPLLFGATIVALVQRLLLLLSRAELYRPAIEDTFFAAVLMLLGLNWALKMAVIQM